MTFLKNFTAAALVAAGGFFHAAPAQAQASDPFIGQMMTVGFNFCPRGWATAEGQLLAISQNTALFSLLGTTFGGDGRTTFGLPDLRGRVSLNLGTGPGLSNVTWGQRGGTERIVQSPAQVGAHTHTATSVMNVDEEDATTTEPAGGSLAITDGAMVYTQNAPNAAMRAGTVSTTVNANSGNNEMTIRNPYLGMLHCIALVGIYPSRS